MENQKKSELLNLALEASQEEREKSIELEVGYDAEEERWDVIVRYVGEIESLVSSSVGVTKLLGNYAILNIPESQIERVSLLPEITYMEKPKRLFFAVVSGRSISCMNPVQERPPYLSGRGVLVACIDSGVDYTHPDFRMEDGSTRILRLWDQTAEGNPPEGYRIGTEFTKEQINEALEVGNMRLSVDNSGHGTAVLGIAAGNGRSSQGVYRGVAWESELIVVKLGNPGGLGFPRTTELMQGVDYVIRQGIALGRPVAINLSFGNNYGAHDGQSLVETYLNEVSGVGKTCICVGTGNEGSSGLHTSGSARNGETSQIELSVGERERTLNLQIWKQYPDEMRIYLTAPNGEQIGPFDQIQEAERFRIGGTNLLMYYGEPSPYSTSQEIYIDFLPVDEWIDSGIWRIHIEGVRILQGDFHMWLPGGGVLGETTKFLQPKPDTTLTIPSTALKVISVAAYDSRLQSYADFSGRGYTRVVIQVKPDLAAPGVNIRTTRVGGGYENVSGTSFATPFVTGAAALMMEWGIVMGNDPYLYGEKVKSYLQRGARQLPGEVKWPNEKLGWGVLCLKDSLPV